jgi:hypothetical protein
LCGSGSLTHHSSAAPVLPLPPSSLIDSIFWNTEAKANGRDPIPERYNIIPSQNILCGE